MSTDLQVLESVIPDALSARSILAQVALIHDVMKNVMQPGVHYGQIPGVEKPTLLKPGAEKLCLTFRLDPQYESTERYEGDHLFVKTKCTLYHITSGRRMGSGEGSCSTKEAKYAYRQGRRLCPACGKEAIIKGKKEYGGGWLCFKKKDGCGAKWPEGAVEIEGQSVERVPNEDIADQYNTVLKMSNKRSLIAAVLNVTAASDLLTQDVEDLPEFQPRPEVAPLPPFKGPVFQKEQGEPLGSQEGAPGPVLSDPQDAHGASPAPPADPAEAYRPAIRTAHTAKEAKAALEQAPEALRQELWTEYTDKLKQLMVKTP